MDKTTSAYYETQLVIALADAQYFKDELTHVRENLIASRSSVDRLLSEVGDLESKLRIAAIENQKLREVIEQHIRAKV